MFSCAVYSTRTQYVAFAIFKVEPRTFFGSCLKLSVLDQSPISVGKTAHEAVQATLDLAEAADKWGYTRYWLAEHHSSGTHCGRQPGNPACGNEFTNEKHPDWFWWRDAIALQPTQSGRGVPDA